MTLFVAHDIGGAQLLFSYVEATKVSEYFFCTEGAAAASQHGLDRSRFIDRKRAEELVRTGKVECVITGTSWASTLEVEFITLAKEHRVKTVSFLDHWTHFKERFGYPKVDWEQTIPDEIWTHDETSYQLASITFPGHSIHLKKNYFFDLNVKNWKDQTSNQKETTILFLSEPIGEQYKSKLGYNEFDSLKFFLEKVRKLVKYNQKFSLTLRPHPSERVRAAAKYAEILKKGFRLSKEEDFFKDLASHQIVVGCDTIGMYYANRLGRIVWCALPLPNTKCTVPISGLRYLRDL